MWVFPPIDKLHLLGVFDANLANRERVIIRPNEKVCLAEYCLCVGVKNAQGGVLPLSDNFLWLGELWVSPPSWIFVYTGPGVYREGVRPDGEAFYELHWGRQHTVFASPDVVPILKRFDSLTIGSVQESTPRPLLPNPL